MSPPPPASHAMTRSHLQPASATMAFTSIGVSTAGHVATVEIRRPPNNFFDITLIEEIITDGGIAPEEHERMESRGITLTCAAMNGDEM